MDGIPPSICPTGTYWPPQHSPTSANAPTQPMPSRSGRSNIVRWLWTFVRKALRAHRRTPEAGA